MAENGNITRRAALKAAPAMGLAAALPSLAVAETTDPAVAAVREWRNLHEVWAQALDAHEDWDNPEVVRLERIEHAALERACEMVATSPAGLAAQFLPAFYLLASRRPGADRNDPASYKFNSWTDDCDGKLMRSMFATAHRLAGLQGPEGYLS